MSTMTLRRWDPFADFDALFRSVGNAGAVAAPSEVVRDGEDAVVRVEIPGIDPENDLSVELTGNSLVIKGERRSQNTENTEARHVREIRYGKFSRSFRLPSHVRESDLTAGYDAGVVTVRVAGAYKGSTPARIPVTAGEQAPELAN